MTRSGYVDDFGSDGWWDLIRYRGAVASAIRGKRGQAFLKRLVEVLEGMEVKELHDDVFARPDGPCCAMGAVAVANGVAPEEFQYCENDTEYAAQTLNIAPALAKEIAFENDEDFNYKRRTPAQRYQYMLAWAKNRIK